MSRRRKLAYLIQRQRGICFLCHKKLTKPTVDHVIPRCRGGTSAMRNLRAACAACNHAKAAMTLQQYREYQRGRIAA